MTFQFIPIPLPPTADSSKLSEFGKEVKGFDPGRPWTEDKFKEIEEGLYKVRRYLVRLLGPDHGEVVCQGERRLMRGGGG